MFSLDAKVCLVVYGNGYGENNCITNEDLRNGLRMGLKMVKAIIDPLSLADRSRAYAETFPTWPAPRTDSRWIDGIWVLGNNYQSTTGYYGSYPPTYLRRIHAMFPDVQLCNILHACSGSLNNVHPCVTLDINPTLQPDVVGNVHCLPFSDGSFHMVIADPPYSSTDAEQYGYPMINRRLMIREAARVTRRNGFLAWLDVQLPMFRKSEWHWFGAIGIVRSTNHRIRLLSLFQRI